MTATEKPPPVGRLGASSAVRSLRLGDVDATYVVDGVVAIRPSAFFPDVPADAWSAWPEFVNARGEIPMSAGGLLVEREGRTLLIDVGVGALTSKFAYGSVDCGSMLDVLAALGRSPDDIDIVAFTHLHFDHAGWAFTTDATGRSVKTFENARYVLSAPEWEPYAKDPDHKDVSTPRHVIGPLASTHALITDGDEIFPGVRAMVTGGHSPGHTCYVITSDTGRRLIVLGDAFHSPAQFAHPDWLSAADGDAMAVSRARERLLDELMRPNTFGFGFHFGDCPFGRLVTDEAGIPSWEPVPTVVFAPAPRGLQAPQLTGESRRTATKEAQS